MKVRTLDRDVEVEVPDDEEHDSKPAPTAVGEAPTTDSRESIRVQAKVAHLGADLGFHIWVPRNDKARVLEHVPPNMHEKFLDVLPLLRAREYGRSVCRDRSGLGPHLVTK